VCGTPPVTAGIWLKRTMPPVPGSGARRKGMAAHGGIGAAADILRAGPVFAGPWKSAR